MSSSRCNSAIHIVIREGRVPDPDERSEEHRDVVAEHNEISGRHSSAFFGKLGRRPDARKLDLVREAIATKRGARLVYVRRSKGDLEAFSAPLRGLHIQHSAVRLLLVPGYYRHLVPSVSVWLEIGSFSQMSRGEIESLVLLSSGKSLLATLSICRTSMMLVRRKPRN